MAANPSEFISNLFNVKSIAEIIKESPAKVIFNKNDIVIYTADKATRSNAFDNFRKAADKIKSNSKSKFKNYHIKPSSKSSLGVFQFFLDSAKLQKASGDIYFKPIITKGSGGKVFENELEKDLNAYFKGEPVKNLKHADTIESLFSNKSFLSIYKITPKNLNAFEAKAVGNRNSKRPASFSNGQISLGNNTGEAVSDIDIIGPNKSIYCSLKFSSSYYIYNGSMKEIFEVTPRVRDEAYKFFGLDGVGMAGFGEIFRSNVVSPKSLQVVRKNLAKTIQLSLGQEVTLINKFGPGKNDIDVIFKGYTSDVLISADPVYKYPESGKRKYAAIEFPATINNDKYAVGMQFRGTTEGALTPRYLRILLKKI